MFVFVSVCVPKRAPGFVCNTSIAWNYSPGFCIVIVVVVVVVVVVPEFDIIVVIFFLD